MAHNLGVIGIGHWFFRLHEGMTKTADIHLVKVASASGVDRHKDQLSRLGVPESSYYQIKGNSIPVKFFEGVDVIQIADPNEFHMSQTMQVLESNKIAITEKTFGVTREEFEKVTKYIIANNLQNKAYLHLHYAHKLLTLHLPELLKRFTKEYGKVTSASATFFEKEYTDAKKRRLWLFDIKSGGLFMDWIHPFEIYYKGALAEKMDLISIETYIVNPHYSTTNPTGAYAKVKLGGIFFAEGVHADIRIAKGLTSREETKVMRFIFEGGQCLDLKFVSSDIEYTTEDRGSWALYEKPNGRIIESDSPKGPTSSDVLVNDILELCRGRNPGFTMEDLDVIFEPQWRYQEMLKSTTPISDKSAVSGFIRKGINIPQNQKVLG